MAEAKEFTQELGAKLRHFRMAKGLSQEQLAFESALNTNSVGMIERGQKCPTAYTLKRLCDSLGITMAEFFLYEEKPVSNEIALRHIREMVEQLTAQDADRVAAIIALTLKMGH